VPDKLTCFVIAPIGGKDTETRKHSDQVLKHIIRKALSGMYTISRADEILHSGIITSQVLRAVQESDIVVADLTEHNPNVFYELAIRHAVGKPVVHLIEPRLSSIPFDLGSFRTIQFDLTDPYSVEAAVAALRQHATNSQSESLLETPLLIANLFRLFSGESEAMRLLKQAVEGITTLTQTVTSTSPQPWIKQESPERNDLKTLLAERTQELHRAMASLERSYDITLEALGGAIDLKCGEPEGHCKRVTAFTVAIARAIGLSSEQIRVIARGAFLHDIGKMAIPDTILRKPGYMTESEHAMMREHCFRGYQMLRRIPFLQDAADIVYSHHERFDGSGYPRGLRSEEIPIGSRIFAIADTLDAITTDRPYRPARSFQAAREEIDHQVELFDPRVLEAYCGMPDNIWEDLREEIASQAQRFGKHSSGGPWRVQ